MHEKTIITGKKGRTMPKLLYVAIGLIAIAILAYLLDWGHVVRYYNESLGITYYRSFIRVFTFDGRGDGAIKYVLPIILYLGLLLLVFTLIIFYAYRKVSITVTDKRVYGTAAWGKRVDLPLDKISAVATSFFHGIAVATSSGSIHFKEIINNEEVHSAISKLLMDRQEKSTPTVESSKASAVPQSNADELKKYKDLLDSGIITQEEFDAKKKQLLGL